MSPGTIIVQLNTCSEFTVELVDFGQKTQTSVFQFPFKKCSLSLLVSTAAALSQDGLSCPFACACDHHETSQFQDIMSTGGPGAHYFGYGA
jgi:hypothetical protein